LSKCHEEIVAKLPSKKRPGVTGNGRLPAYIPPAVAISEQWAAAFGREHTERFLTVLVTVSPPATTRGQAGDAVQQRCRCEKETLHQKSFP
jgi:hypothetical protein